MKSLRFTIGIVALTVWLSPVLAGAQPGSADSDAGIASKESSTKRQSLVLELKALREGVAAKQAELAKLRHKWMVSKGRTPTEEEVKEFEKKRARGEATAEDNPYVNRNPLSSPARWRAAYYEKLAEIKKEKERAALLEQELGALAR
ncbi:hypothetical protein [Geobacter sp.]|uniref:hypothetical protein n=1 Tax=Geobacter sp. TaxID=46610 RepID=UPI00261B2981|nr:hypothetical protein [Geobacter sp.]